MGLTKFIFYNLMGWKVEGAFYPEVKKAVVIVVPHTSWHDFYIGVFARRISRTQIHWIGKKELFKWPFGGYFRWMGGTPIDRTPGQNKVQNIAKLFEEREEFRLALAPEGTRKKVDTWRTGYYYIALEAKVPIVPVAFNYKTKTVIINPPYQPIGDIEKDTMALKAFYDGVVGKRPEYT